MEEQHRGAALFPTSTLVPVTVVCVLLLAVGTSGNAVTILVIRRFKDMRTTTNLYLSSMAVSDLLIFLGLPFDLYRLWKYAPWVFGQALCRLSHYVNESCTNATVLHITTLSVERYLAVCFPLKAKAAVSRWRVKLTILALWGVALLSAAPVYFLMGVEYDNQSAPHPDTRQCKHTRYAVESGLLHATILLSTCYFFCPMCCLLFLYGSIGRKLWSGGRALPGPGGQARLRAQRQAVKILALVVLAFAACWLPYHIGRFLFTHVDSYASARFSQDFNVASMVLFYLSASINPVLYNLMSHKYRAAARRLFTLPRPLRRDVIATCADTLTGLRPTVMTE